MEIDRRADTDKESEAMFLRARIKVLEERVRTLENTIDQMELAEEDLAGGRIVYG